MHQPAAGRSAGGWLVQDGLGWGGVALLHVASYPPEGQPRLVLLTVLESRT